MFYLCYLYFFTHTGVQQTGVQHTGVQHDFYVRGCSCRNTTGVTCGTETANPSGVHEFIPG